MSMSLLMMAPHHALDASKPLMSCLVSATSVTAPPRMTVSRGQVWIPGIAKISSEFSTLQRDASA